MKSVPGDWIFPNTKGELFMPEVVKFKAFCLERYKHAHNLNGPEVLDLFVKYGVMDYIGSFYDVLHTFGDKYIVADIEEFITAHQIA